MIDIQRDMFLQEEKRSVSSFIKCRACELTAHPCPGEAHVNANTGHETICLIPGYANDCPSMFYKCMIDPAVPKGYCCPGMYKIKKLCF